MTIRHRALLLVVLGLTALVGESSAQCMRYGAWKSSGTLPVDFGPKGVGEEISGIAASKLQPDVLWTHDDRGNGPYLIAMRKSGQLVQHYFVLGASNADWEDIAYGPGPEPGRGYLYLGDIGDNDATRATYTIYRVPEPQVPTRPGTVVFVRAEAFTVRYPSGSRNSEALFVDPQDGTPYIVNKEGGKTSDAWRVPMPLKTSVQTLVHVAKIAVGDAKFSAADTSPDGRRIYLRNSNFVYYYERKLGQSVAQALTTAPCNVWAGGQGNAEALAISADGLSMIATSEGRAAKIWQITGTLPSPGPKTVPSHWGFGSGLRGNAQLAPSLSSRFAPILGHRAIELAGFDARPNSVSVVLLSTVALQTASLVSQADGSTPNPTSSCRRRPTRAAEAPCHSAYSRRSAPCSACVWPLNRFVIDAAAAKGFALSRGLMLQLDA